MAPRKRERITEGKKVLSELKKPRVEGDASGVTSSKGSAKSDDKDAPSKKVDSEVDPDTPAKEGTDPVESTTTTVAKETATSTTVPTEGGETKKNPGVKKLKKRVKKTE